MIIENEEIKLFFFSSNRDQFRLDKLHVQILHILSKYGIFNHLFKCNMPIHQIKFHYIKTLYKIMALKEIYIYLRHYKNDRLCPFA